MSVRRCSACGNTTKGEVPFCGTCGALFPVGDEDELMRQAVGYSFDLKWVLVGTLVALVLQLALLGGLWSFWGAKILVGERGRSLLQVNLDSISPQWGPNTGGTRVVLGIKPDSKNVNTALTVIGVTFGGAKAEPFHLQNLRVVQAECQGHCANRVKAGRLYRECIQGCDEAKIKEDEKRLTEALKPCFDLEDQKNRGELKLARFEAAYKRANCDVLTRQGREFNKLKERCEEDCPRRKKHETAEDARCTFCQKQMTMYTKRAADCQKDVSRCWAFFDPRGTVEPPKPTDFKTPAEYQKARDAAIKLEKTYRGQEQNQLRTRVNVYTPSLPGGNGLVDVTLHFKSGEKLVKSQGFAFTPPGRKERPAFEMTKQRLHDPVRTLGFWLLLTLSSLFYLAAGFVLGRLSPGIGIKEPLTAGMIAWLVFEVILVLLGTAGTAQIFTVFIGAPLFIGCTLLGSTLADRSLGYA